MKIDSTSSAIFFDLDDTLYDLMAPFASALQKELPHVSHILDSEIDLFFSATRHHIDGLWKEYLKGEKTLQEIRIERYRLAARDFNLTISTDEGKRLQEQYEVEQAKISLPADVEALLRELNDKNVCIGIITNGTTEGQTNKIKTLELGQYFLDNHIFISNEIGLAKPQPEIFHFVHERCQLENYTCYYIGDSWNLDVEGALSTNWYPIWFNHRDREPQRQTEGYLEISNLSQLYIV
ncbi:putative hydrolase of the HAD superfamily [Gracilibacillus orientalis]|uniref:Putative hydrolase of the HAD superfamily n=1 Tax=Gracilibacillus orientalis TaxID=334253 RepID=A0A1I4MWW3_9BACI|nr:HAD family hydrolase [Gracilibacillus orientalis]SFM07473.1 putative hydrolase of the HAD superfamily [Gracilibacillus orientalis]